MEVKRRGEKLELGFFFNTTHTHTCTSMRGKEERKEKKRKIEERKRGLTSEEGERWRHRRW